MNITIFIFFAVTTLVVYLLAIVMRRYSLLISTIPLTIIMMFSPWLLEFEETSVVDKALLTSGNLDSDGNIYKIIEMTDKEGYGDVFFGKILIVTNPSANVTVIHKVQNIDTTTAMAISMFFLLVFIIVLLHFWLMVGKEYERGVKTGGEVWRE